MVGATKNMISMISNSKVNWKTVFASGGTAFVQVDIRKKIIQGHSLSPLLLYSNYVTLDPRDQGRHTGESARLPPMCPGFDSQTRRHMWTEFVGSLLCSKRFFSGYCGFPLSSKSTFNLVRFDLFDSFI